MREFDARGLSNVAWGFAKAPDLVPVRVWDALAAAAVARIQTFSPHGLSNLVWAVATAEATTEATRELFAAVAAEAAPRANDLSARGLCNLAWAFATHGAVDFVRTVELFAAISRAALPMLDGFTPQGIANAAWAFSSMGVAAPRFFQRIGDRVVRGVRDFDGKGLSSTAWAFAIADARAPDVYAAVAREVCRRPACLDSQRVSNLLRALACADQPDLVRAVAEKINLRARDFEGNSLQLSQLYQVWLAIPDVVDLAPPCRAAFVDSRDGLLRPSQLQHEVAGVMRRLGWPFDFEFATEDGLAVDMALGQQNLLSSKAIEVYGPYHYVIVVDDEDAPREVTADNSGGRLLLLNGKTRFKERLLSDRGWTVCRVPYFEWPEASMWV
ncbi:hypothetical protein CTAYLR_005479 [Chrysophaeum taylorii]|uniref:RAP domain-containing protein n=1 Tax=Chrysophaeum taylorii TaxID=2483200 RepID=A0AAD7U6M0_9STRA|nr:hypothetical protein CTAYLR_005479 [Chrysophaeum taylorii]